MIKLSCIYTAFGAMIKPLEQEFIEALGGDARCNSIADSNLMMDILAEGGIDETMEKRILALFDSAVNSKVDAVLCTCSSIGNVADKAARLYPDKKIFRIDYAMAREAALHYKNIAVLSTLETTLVPTCSLIRRIAEENGREVHITTATPDSAFAAMIAGDMDKCESELQKAAKELCKNADILLLAQMSMESFLPGLERILDVPVLESPPTCAEFLKQELL